MRLLAYAKLLSNKINALNKQTRNPYHYWEDSTNPFRQRNYNTLIWVEPEPDNDDFPNFKNYKQ